VPNRLWLSVPVKPVCSTSLTSATASLLVLYGGLILCLPASRRRKLTYIIGGIIGIEILNVLRCAGLVLVYLHKPEWLDFSHHYLFTFVVYAFIFWLWYLFSRNPEFAKKLQLDATPR